MPDMLLLFMAVIVHPYGSMGCQHCSQQETRHEIFLLVHFKATWKCLGIEDYSPSYNSSNATGFSVCHGKDL